jgi:hypothetical protein
VIVLYVVISLTLVGEESLLGTYVCFSWGVDGCLSTTCALSWPYFGRIPYKKKSYEGSLSIIHATGQTRFSKCVYLTRVVES